MKLHFLWHKNIVTILKEMHINFMISNGDKRCTVLIIAFSHIKLTMFGLCKESLGQICKYIIESSRNIIIHLRTNIHVAELDLKYKN